MNKVRWLLTTVLLVAASNAFTQAAIPWPPNLVINPEHPTQGPPTLTFSDVWPDSCVPAQYSSFDYEIRPDGVYVTIKTPIYITCNNQATAWELSLSPETYQVKCYDVYVALEDSYHGNKPFTKVGSYCIGDANEPPAIPWPPEVSAILQNPQVDNSIKLTFEDAWPDNCVPRGQGTFYRIIGSRIQVTIITPSYISCTEENTLWEQEITLDSLPNGCYEVWVALEDAYHGNQSLKRTVTFCIEDGIFSANLISNSSFEDHTNGNGDPDGWSLWGSDWQQGDSTQAWWQDCNLARTGCWTARLRAGSNDFALASSPVIETVPQKTYYVGVWIKDLKPANLRSATAARFEFLYLDSETQGNLDESKIYAAELPIPLDNQWHWVHVEMNPSTTHPWVRVLLLVENSANDGSESDYLFDDFWFGEALPYRGNRYVAIAAGSYHNLALKYDGSIVGWGNDDYGQADPPPGNDYIAVAAGQYYSLALRADGTLIAWGDNSYGQTDVPDGNDFVAISSGLRHGLALTADGRILQWGDEQRSQGTPPEEMDYVGIAAGTFQSLALKTDGSLVGWGNDSYGQASPPDGNDFLDMTGSRRYSVGLKSNGSIIGWGTNPDLETGMPTGTDFVSVDIGAAHGIALKADGNLIAWGSNELGQTETPGGNNFIAISAGRDHCLALRRDGTIVGWGNNDFGQAMPPEGND